MTDKESFDEDKYSIFWFINADNGEKYKIYANGKVEWSKENKKGYTVFNQTTLLRMQGYKQGYGEGYKQGYKVNHTIR